MLRYLSMTGTMLKKVSAVTAAVAAFVLLFVSITHACSGLASMDVAVQQSPMNMGAGDITPCSKEKGDICKSVRDSLLSVKPSTSSADNPQQTVPALAFAVDSPIRLVPSPGAANVGIGFHPVFKLPLTVSYRVLRI